MPDRDQPSILGNHFAVASVLGRLGRMWCALVCHSLIATFCAAETYTEHFDSPETTWEVLQSEQGAHVIAHRRIPSRGHKGGSENITIQTDRDDQKIRLEHRLPEVRALNELEVGLWVRANHPGVHIHLRVVLPEFQDTVTGRPLSFLVPGDVLGAADDWEHLTCRADEKLIHEKLVALRAKLHRKILAPRMYVDRVFLTWSLIPGENEISIDELSFGPLVRIDESEIRLVSRQMEHETEPPASFRLDRIEIEHKPCFPRIVPYHGEPLRNLAGAGFNVVWVPDGNDRALLTSVRREGMWATATPPWPNGNGNDTQGLPLENVGLMPFSKETEPIIFWMLGTRISPRQEAQVLQWATQIRDADRKYRRALVADVSGDERVFSNELDMLGLSRHVIGSSFSLMQYRDWLKERGELARKGSFRWTWIQTVPSSVLTPLWEAHQIPLQLEPEQLRLQVYAALATGVRGIGFWTPRALREENPADRETIEALRQLNLELKLLEPWLATSGTLMHLPVSLVTNSTGTGSPRSQFLMNQSAEARWEREAQNRHLESQRRIVQQAEKDLFAVALQTDYDLLLLPMWLEQNSQYVPGKLAAEALSITVPGVSETASVWEITPTGVHNLEREQVSSGVRFTLRNFDQTACILLTSKLDSIQQIRERVSALQEPCARSYLESAKLKLDRVRDVDQRLGELGLRQPDGPQLLGAARELYLEAESAAARQDWSRVRQKSQQAMQMVRILQRAHWEDAVASLPSPVSSPFATSFQSLPEQAQFAMQITDGQASVGNNLLSSGNFEDEHSQIPLGWRHEQDTPDDVRAFAQLDPESPRRGKYCLRLWADHLQSAARPAFGGREFVSYITPPITVQKGEAVRFSGWLKIPHPLQASPDGLMIYDSLTGRNLALRMHETHDWQRFEIVREVQQSQDVTFTLALTALGEVRLDDLEVTTSPLSKIAPASAQQTSPRPRSASGLRRWSDLGRWNPLPSRRTKSTDPAR